jgi:hypothetical protein
MCSSQLVPVFCHILFDWQAAKRGLKYPRYTWIIYDWFPEGWWKSRDTDKLICSNEEMKTVLERAISFRRHPLLKQGNSITDAGIVSIITYRTKSYYMESQAALYTAFSNIHTIKLLTDTNGISSKVFNES